MTTAAPPVARGALLTPAPTRVMGILNVTPDSFSDGGRWDAPEAAIARGRELVARGAALVDVGGESTRPGSRRVTPEEEQRRILPVVDALAAEGIAVSVDTLNAATARAAVDAGAAMVNDVSGGTYDPAMAATVAELGVPWIVQHWRGTPETMASHAHYDDVVTEVRDELAARLEAAVAAGVDPELVVLDPGLGFAKDADHNWAVLARLETLAELGRPLLVGASRKRFLADVAPQGGAAERDDATAAVTALCAAQGVWGVRVHEVGASIDAVRVAEAVRAGGAL